MLQSKSLTILFTDMKDFTQRMSEVSRFEGIDLIKKHENLLLPVLEAFGGKLVKTIGDSFLVAFESPTNAVLGGMELQRTLREHNASLSDPQKKIEVRVAIHTGEVTVTDNDVYGETVNIASRILGISEPNEVYFTEAVYLSMNKKEVPSSEIGYRYLKGITEKIKIYKVLPESPVPALLPGEMPAPLSQSPSGAASIPQTQQESPPKTSPLPQPGVTALPEKHSGYGGFWIRLLAAIIDLIIVVILSKIVVSAFTGRNFADIRSHDLNLVIPLVLYFGFYLSYKSTTAGKAILGLKVVNEQAKPLSRKESWMRVLGYVLSAATVTAPAVAFALIRLRVLGYFLSVATCGIGFLWIAFDRKKQGLHDRILKQYVVKTKPKAPWRT